MKTKVLVVIGPTASGKTSFAVEVAARFNGEIISADSMQIYKGMNIATAKPTRSETRGIKHYLIDFLDAGKSYSVGQYVIDAKNAISETLSKNKVPIICGGTGLYVDSLIDGIDFVENSSNPEIRSQLVKLCEEKGADYLLDILKEFDSESARRLSDEINPKRIIRAIEFYKTTGITITKQNENSRKRESEFEPLYIGLKAADRQYLYDRINRRVDIMVEQGLIDEAKEVLSSDLSETSSKAIGYKQLIPYFSGEMSLHDCIEQLKTETRHYAKRQLTWFNRNKNINWINIDEYKTSGEQVDYAEKLIKGFLYG